MYNMNPNPLEEQKRMWSVISRSPQQPILPRMPVLPRPHESPVDPGYFAQPGSTTYAKQVPFSPVMPPRPLNFSERQQQAENLAAFLQRESIVGADWSNRLSDEDAMTKALKLTEGLTTAGQTNYPIRPIPAPTPQQPSIYGTPQTPLAIPRGLFGEGQESPAQQTARILKPMLPAQQEINAAYKSQNPEYVRFAVTKHQGAEAGNKAYQDMITNQQAGFKQKQTAELAKRELTQTGELARKASVETEETKRITGIEKLYGNAAAKATKDYEVYVNKIEKQQEKYQEFMNEYEDAQALDAAEAEKTSPTYWEDREAVRVRRKYAKYGFDKITSMPEILSFEGYMTKYQPQAYKAMQSQEKAISDYYFKSGTEALAPKSKTTANSKITEEAFKAFDATYPKDNVKAIEDIDFNQAAYEAQGVDILELKRKILERK